MNTTVKKLNRSKVLNTIAVYINGLERLLLASVRRI